MMTTDLDAETITALRLGWRKRRSAILIEIGRRQSFCDSITGRFNPDYFGLKARMAFGGPQDTWLASREELRALAQAEHARLEKRRMRIAAAVNPYSACEHCGNLQIDHVECNCGERDCKNYVFDCARCGREICPSCSDDHAHCVSCEHDIFMDADA